MASAQIDLIFYTLIVQNTKGFLYASMYGSVSQPFLPRGTFDKLFIYFAAPQDAKIGQKVNKNENWRHPWHYPMAP